MDPDFEVESNRSQNPIQGHDKYMGTVGRGWFSNLGGRMSKRLPKRSNLTSMNHRLLT